MMDEEDLNQFKMGQGLPPTGCAVRGLSYLMSETFGQ